MKRIQSIDFVRGVVMIIMALDHVRDLMHVRSITQSPTNLETTSPALFFTRWITYLCAPTFVFLAGTSAYMSLKNKNDLSKSRNFLLKRGIYLIVLELVVVNFLLFFDPGYHTIIWEVIAAIGFGFIMLSLLLKASWKTIAILGIAIIFLHNLTAIAPFAETSLIKRILMPFFAPTPILVPGRVLVIAYPPIPWLGIMLAGFVAGKLFDFDQARRKKIFCMLGLAAIVLFLLIRSINIYGDSVPWSVQKTSLFTFLSFMNVTKYPPSLVFSLITLGIMFLILCVAEGLKGKVNAIVSVYGKVPLFYFLLHFLLIHLTLLAVMLLQGFSWSQLDFASGNFGRPKGVESGLPLFNIYLLWICIVVILYWPCKWFGNYKATHSYWWLKYL